MKQLRLLGFVLPPLYVIVYYACNAAAYSAAGMTMESLFFTITIISIFVWGWSYGFAISTNKFFTKRNYENKKGQVFGAHSIAFVASFIIYLASTGILGGTLNTLTTYSQVQNFSDSLKFIIPLIYISQFVVQSIVAVFITSKIYDADYKKSLNANKLAIFILFVVYSLLAVFASFLTRAAITAYVPGAL